jgi:hypothetical protein
MVITGFGPRGELPSPSPSLSSPPLLLPCARPHPSPLARAVPTRGSPPSAPARGDAPPSPPGARRCPSLCPQRAAMPLPRPLARWRPLPQPPSRGGGPLLLLPSRDAAPPGPWPLGHGSLAALARGPYPRTAWSPTRHLSGARPLDPDSAAPRGSPSVFPRAQPQRTWRSNLGLISF